MKRFFSLFSAAILCLSVAACASHQNAVDPDVNKDASGLALGGYDPVAYFDGAAQPGSPNHELTYRGATYLFASARNRERFERDPEAYLPAFGGYCAFGVAAKQAKVPANPKTFRIQDGRLLLFFNGPFEGQVVDTSKFWDKDPVGMLRDADAHWKTLRGTTP